MSLASQADVGGLPVEDLVFAEVDCQIHSASKQSLSHSNILPEDSSVESTNTKQCTVEALNFQGIRQHQRNRNLVTLYKMHTCQILVKHKSAMGYVCICESCLATLACFAWCVLHFVQLFFFPVHILQHRACSSGSDVSAHASPAIVLCALAVVRPFNTSAALFDLQLACVATSSWHALQDVIAISSNSMACFHAG